LLSILADEVVEYSDGGGKTSAALKPIYGPAKVARYMLGVLNKLPAGLVIQPALVNGQPAIVGYVNQQPYVVLAIDIVDGRIRSVYNILNPDKLKGIPPLS
jgi:RNA polymerase sigma-70 factor (ECF subfamily)